MYNFKIFHISLLNKSSESYRPLGNIVFILEAALCISSKHSWAFPLCLYPHLTFSPALCRLRFPVLFLLCLSMYLTPFLEMKEKQCICKNKWNSQSSHLYKTLPGKENFLLPGKTFQAGPFNFSCLPSFLKKLLKPQEFLECRKAPGHNDPSAFPVFSPFLGGEEGEGGEEQRMCLGRLTDGLCSCSPLNKTVLYSINTGLKNEYKTLPGRAFSNLKKKKQQ